MNILITGGGTSEPIDSVRYITNFSTGKTSSFLADFFASRKSENGEQINVTALLAENAIKPKSKNVKVITFKTFCDLQNALKSECKKDYDAIIHAAAVSDFSVESVEIDGKSYFPNELKKISSGNEVVLCLKKNPKILSEIKAWTKNNSKRRTKLVAFKLTSGAEEEEQLAAVRKLFLDSENSGLSLESPDFVVQNDKAKITENEHPCKIFAKDEKQICKVVAKTKTLEDLAESLKKLVIEPAVTELRRSIEITEQ